MRHGKSGKKFGRTSTHRKAMFRNMVTSLLSHERIVTTEVKAKEIARLAEKMITLGKKGDLHARRQAVAFVRSNEVVKRLFTIYQARYADRQGGYTRILKLEPRPGDNAPMAIVELVGRPVEQTKDKSPKSKEKAGKEPKTQAPKPKKEAKAQSPKSKEKMTGEKDEKTEPEKKKKAPAKKETEAKKETKAKSEAKEKAGTKAKAGAKKTSKAKKEETDEEKKE
jgi:large subunit ribosomal protein L17